MNKNPYQDATSRRYFIKTFLSSTLLTVVDGKVLTARSTVKQSSTSAPSSPAQATPGQLDKVTFVTSWYAQAEHGGYYQAVATKIYKKYGLDLTIKMGGPQVNNTQLLMGVSLILSWVLMLWEPSKQ